jgi:FlaA1/EpsC-like NDP-sugar epimerase
MKITNNYSFFVKLLISLPRINKNILVMFADYTMLVLSFWISLSIRINDIYFPSKEALYLILLGPLIALPIFFFLGLYKSLIRYSSYKSIFVISEAIIIYSLLWFFIVISSSIVIRPYDFLLINFLLSIFLTGGIRYLARWLLIARARNDASVLIYGAGTAGMQLRGAISYTNDIKVVGFIDDDKRIQGKYVEGLKIYPRNTIKKLLKSNKKITEVIIAIPSLSRSKIQEIVESLKEFSIVIRVLPSVSDIAKGKIEIADLKAVKIEDLLRRDIRDPDKELLQKNITDKSVLVTGAGGSIGSELCRQIIQLEPSRLVLFDISEASLYLIEQELREYDSNVSILAIIGNVTRRSRLDYILNTYEINTVYHAAAYKHVPLVEKNTIPGIRCNIFGTLTLIQAAMNASVDNFVFISTDKAVRPTNIMGATKRFAELILQALAFKNNSETSTNKAIKISIVRFGNVLGSSGSVVPLFKEQIKKGGPITVTDPSIIRYFMTITEAAQLVIQAGALKSDGHIFLLDMGDQVKVLDLAKDMVRLSGMTIKDVDHPDGDIEIIFTGLRPGEKLYEELLIDNKAIKTKHEKIMKATEERIEWSQLHEYLIQLELAIEESDFKKVRDVFLKTVSGYHSSIAD